VLLAAGIAIADLVPRLGSDSTTARPLDAAGVALLLVPCVALVWRRTRPIPVLLITCGCLLLVQVREYVEAPSIFLSLLAASYAAGAYCRSRAGILTALVILVGYVVTVHVASPAAPPPMDEAIGVASIVAGTFVLGRSLGLGRAYTAQLEQRAADLARGREAELRGVVGEERARIARDLHDVVAHTLTTINVQAATAAELLDRDPRHARAALETIEDASRDAIDELRAILGILRDPDGGEPPLAPAPGVETVAELVQSTRDGGVDVRLQSSGERPERLPDAVSLAAFRIVQESLTNVRRHAPGAPVRVSVSFEPSHLAVAVENGASGASNGNRASPGVGIMGMTERASAVGGTLRAVALPDGFRVDAVLPYTRAGA
jgi:signal transduction histidine kinase